MDKDNANPTILTAADLPTRQRAKKASAVHSAFDSDLSAEITGLPSYLSGVISDVPWSDESDETEDDFTDEPIDEQEIYGKITPMPPQHTSRLILPPISSRCGRHVE